MMPSGVTAKAQVPLSCCHLIRCCYPRATPGVGVCFLLLWRISESGWQFLCMEAGDVSPQPDGCVGYMDDTVAVVQGIYNYSCSL